MDVISMESLFAAIDETGEQAVLVSVPDMRIVHANRGYLAAVGMGLEEAKGLCCHSVSHHLDHPCDGDGHKCPVRISENTGNPASAVHLHSGKNGEEVLVDVSSRPIRDGSGRITHVLEIIRRNDERRRLLEDLQRKSGFLENLLHTCPEGIIGNDMKGNIFLFNEGAERIFGYARAEVIGKIHAKDLYPPGGAREVRDRAYSESFGGPGRLVDFETCIVDKSGIRVPIRLCCTVIKENGEDSGFIGFFTDIKERKAMEESLRTLSITDGLTGLYNRRHFQSIATKERERILRSKGHSSLLLIDVDHFKRYNDSYGHAEGDIVLTSLASLIKKSFRAVDTGFRFGGEEFAVLLPDTASEHALVPAERLRTEFASIPFLPAGGKGPLSVTVSIGISELIADRSLDDMVRLADAAMYEAKNRGRNRTVILDTGFPVGP
jgi:diguanylate cyclase (GGDEF)-like protein/PAS domain S-box-containing protein